MKNILTLLILFTFFSCSSTMQNNRSPAADEPNSCFNLAQNLLMNDNYKEDLAKVMGEKKLISFKEKLMLVQYAPADWINRVKTSLTNSLRNWNNSKYPAFYIFNDEEVIPIAKTYAQNIEKILSGEVPSEDAITNKAMKNVHDWISTFEGYTTDMDQLLDQRISLQYNIDLLKNIYLAPNEVRDIQITVKRSGELQNEIITLRTEDKNLGFTISKLKTEMDQLDESFGHNGKIKERIIRQAMLKDMITIIQRELEYALKNAASPSPQALAELEKLTTMINSVSDAPSTYGVYKITNKVFMRELAAASKLDTLYQKMNTPIKDLIAKAPATTPDGLASAALDPGALQNTYGSVSGITPMKIVSGAVLVLGGIGIDKYFVFKSAQNSTTTTTEVTNSPQDKAHLSTITRTKNFLTKKKDELSHIVQVEMIDIQKESKMLLNAHNKK